MTLDPMSRVRNEADQSRGHQQGKIMVTVFETDEFAFPIKVEQHGERKALFKVTYGMQVSDNLPYSRAASEFGLCMFHALACEGKLNNGGE